MKKYISAILCVIGILLLAIFGVLILLIISSAFIYNPPEGYTKEHHTYEEILAYAKEIDENATVSEVFIDTTDENGRAVREWYAVIHGVECHVASTADWVWNGGFIPGEFRKRYYVIDTDYDYYLLSQIVEEKQPDWKISDDDLLGRYNCNGIISVYTSYTEKRELADAEIENAWQEALEIYTEYDSHNVRKEACFWITIPQVQTDNGDENKYIAFSDDCMRDFSEEGKIEFFRKYREAWTLLESGLPIEE
ncbi:MAG: hypothetical protein IJX55_06995 [Clostridia bacterium]|nr:hypothetical protein [Clostridia bacterium]